jgi:hypothetical protein
LLLPASRSERTRHDVHERAGLCGGELGSDARANDERDSGLRQSGHGTSATGKQALCDASGLIAGPEFGDRGSQLATAAPITISQT